MIIVGGQAHGESFFADAAAYNPATGSWRKLASMSSPRFNATLTWTGSQVLAVGGERDFRYAPYTDALAYNRTTDRWRRLSPMEPGRADHTAVWTGHQLIVWGGRTRAASGPDYTAPTHGLVYDPAADVWSALPKAPIRSRTGAITVDRQPSDRMGRSGHPRPLPGLRRRSRLRALTRGLCTGGTRSFALIGRLRPNRTPGATSQRHDRT
jgi:N-acetylneuraminic acid mutarotase